MGQAKQLLTYKGKSLVKHSVDAILKTNAGSVILVTGANAATVAKEAEGTKAHVVENAEWQEGIASSIRCGLNALTAISPNTERAIFMVCDQPFVTAELLNQLVFTSVETGKQIVACTYGGTVGIPALFGKAYFPLLLQLQGDEGAKKIIRRYSYEVGTVSFPQGEIDIDTPDDYAGLNSFA